MGKIVHQTYRRKKRVYSSSIWSLEAVFHGPYIWLNFAHKYQPSSHWSLLQHGRGYNLQYNTTHLFRNKLRYVYENLKNRKEL